MEILLGSVSLIGTIKESTAKSKEPRAFPSQKLNMLCRRRWDKIQQKLSLTEHPWSHSRNTSRPTHLDKCIDLKAQFKKTTTLPSPRWSETQCHKKNLDCCLDSEPEKQTGKVGHEGLAWQWRKQSSPARSPWWLLERVLHICATHL